ncbi:hypothetical protein SeMB42_g00871 [Synchytrium endobioticum]|uniref:Uncharacterized protein n=1 Tax=Synchytrium endobioticum TaxID=286115 RepID=A0A507DQU2_9FUNG|nr:hypothetical protein SeMB42_g00871 [Synchytrium endobioticum]
MRQLYGIEATMQPGTSCTASCMNGPLPSALVRSRAAPTQSRINHDSQFLKTYKVARTEAPRYFKVKDRAGVKHWRRSWS